MLDYAGGGIGVPYKPGQPPLDLPALGHVLAAKVGASSSTNRYMLCCLVLPPRS